MQEIPITEYVELSDKFSGDVLDGVEHIQYVIGQIEQFGKFEGQDCRKIFGEWHIAVDSNWLERQRNHPKNEGDAQPKQNQRLGIITNITGVEDVNIQRYAKIIRVFGLLVTISFVIWATFFEYTWRGSFFYLIFREIGIGQDAAILLSYGLAAIILLMGWYFRFVIGYMFMFIFSSFYKAFKKI